MIMFVCLFVAYASVLRQSKLTLQFNCTPIAFFVNLPPLQGSSKCCKKPRRFYKTNSKLKACNCKATLQKLAEPSRFHIQIFRFIKPIAASLSSRLIAAWLHLANYYFRFTLQLPHSQLLLKLLLKFLSLCYRKVEVIKARLGSFASPAAVKVAVGYTYQLMLAWGWASLAATFAAVVAALTFESTAKGAYNFIYTKINSLLQLTLAARLLHYNNLSYYRSSFLLPFLLQQIGGDITSESEPLVKYLFSITVLCVIVLLCFINVFGYIFSLYLVAELLNLD